MEATFMMIAKTFAGLEEVLAKELETLGAGALWTVANDIDSKYTKINGQGFSSYLLKSRKHQEVTTRKF